MDRLRPSPQAGWRTAEEVIALVLGPEWRCNGTYVDALANIERALNRLTWNGQAERTVFNQWTWWRSI